MPDPVKLAQRLVCIVLSCSSIGLAQDTSQDSAKVSPKGRATDVQRDLDANLARAGDRAPAWRSALADLDGGEQRALKFLLAYMPEQDLADLDPEAVKADARLAHQTWQQAPWASAVPESVFLNWILPYAHVTEERAPWRADFRERFAARVADCETTEAAALKLNSTIFADVSVRYSRQRERADQNVQQSMASGVASCTGLSILLANACRAVGVPARLAGIASWPEKRGNHTWVEVWHDGGWHFVGAAEPDAKGLNHTWFQADVAKAQPGHVRHGVWAATWQHTGHWMPMVWAPAARVPAVDSTHLYIAARDPAAPATETMRLMLVVYEGAQRVAADVVLEEVDGELSFAGKSHDESSDGNNHLTFDVPPGRRWSVRVQHNNTSHSRLHESTDPHREILRIQLDDPVAKLSPKITAWFSAAIAGTETKPFSDEENALLLTHGPRAREVAWHGFLAAQHPEELAADLAANVVRTEDRESPYTVEEVGTKPTAGWGLVIAMHGGGGVKKRVNDGQWRHMQVYYKKHPEAGGYKYVALRAPNDTWNGFYDTAITPLIERLIRQFVVCGEVDPRRVFAIGYSHGGYGAFAIGPKIPDRFAAVHASAAAPTPGITVADNLRHLRFRFMVGERDTAYGRLKRCDEFGQQLDALRGDRDDIYPTRYDRIAGNGHGGLPDRDLLAELLVGSRSPLSPTTMPADLTWVPTGPEVRAFYWLTSSTPSGRVVATVTDNALELRADDVTDLAAVLDDRLVDYARPLLVREGEKVVERVLSPTWDVLLETMLQRGDPDLCGTCRIALK